MIPRLVIAAPASGQGKTTVTTGLLAALRRRTTTVAPFKVGPDYIDPGYHAIAAGRRGRNLDPVLVGEQRVAPLFAHGSAGAELAVIEGVMGLFDGRLGVDRDGPALGSTAHVATLLDAPVVLVVDATGQSHSIAALLHGFRSYHPSVRIGGVILNRVGSPRHDEVLREAAEAAGLPVLGSLPRTDGLSVPSRHLGLVTAAERRGDAETAVREMADTVEAGVDLDAVTRMAATAPELDRPAWDPSGPDGVPEATATRPTIAVAGGPAFTFGYAEHTELLRAAGAEVAVVDPLQDESLPPGTAGLVLPGGFPEEHAEALSANAALRREVAEFVQSGGPVHAECGGLLYLSRELDGHPLCGVLDARAHMSPRLTLGYRDAVASGNSVLFTEGQRVSGHEFHRTVLEPGRGPEAAWFWRGREGPVAEGWLHHNVHASYLHTHPAGNPGAVARFVELCSRHRHS